MMKRLPLFVMSLFAVVTATGLSAGEEKNPKHKAKAPAVTEKASAAAKTAAKTSSATVDAIMETATRNIGRRYNLNEAQLGKTRELMRREVYKFLQTHEDQVWPLIRDLLKAQLGQKPPESIEDVMRIGKGALPLAQLAQEAIINANEEWREYLTAEQRVTHDYDMAEMRKTFKSINNNFERWAEGKPTGKSIFPKPPPPAASPPRPPKPLGKLPEPAEESIAETTMFFEAYVNEFIAKYELDAGQVNAARSILGEFKGQAAKFRATNYKEIAAISQELLDAQKQRDRKRITEIEGRRRKLLQHVYALFAEMDSRLQGLLRTVQRERFADKSNEKSPTKPAQTPPKVKPKPGQTKDDGKATTKSAKQKPKSGGTQSAASQNSRDD